MPELSRRELGLGLGSLLVLGCTTRSAMPAYKPHATHAPVPSPGGAKLKILCLHGYHGSARVLRGQMAAFAAGLEGVAELVFLDAPSLAAGDFGWWHAVDNDVDPDREDPGVTGPHRHYKGWTRTRDAIVACFASQGPFDGIL